MDWRFIVGLFLGIGISEYYNRFRVDKIREEDIARERGEYEPPKKPSRRRPDENIWKTKHAA